MIGRQSFSVLAFIELPHSVKSWSVDFLPQAGADFQRDGKFILLEVRRTLLEVVEWN
jgi:hypothetical protein